MKLTVIIFVFISAFCQAQPVVTNRAVINTIYAGVTNPISISLTDKSSKYLTVQVSDGIITQDKIIGKYQWQLCDSIKHQVYLKIYERSKLIDSIPFKVKRFDNIQMLLRPLYIHRIGYQGIRAEINNESFEGVRVELLEFKITLVRGKDSTTITNKTAFFQDKAKAVLSSLQQGDELIYFDFQVKVGCENIIRKLNSVYAQKALGPNEEEGF